MLATAQKPLLATDPTTKNTTTTKLAKQDDKTSREHHQSPTNPKPTPISPQTNVTETHPTATKTMETTTSPNPIKLPQLRQAKPAEDHTKNSNYNIVANTAVMAAEDDSISATSTRNDTKQLAAALCRPVLGANN